MGNFIKIDRKILEWEWYRNEHTKNVFLHCLLKANWKDTKIEGKIIPRGAFISSVGKIAEELELTTAEVRTALKHLNLTNEITSKGTNRNTVFTVTNYDLYQASEQAEQQTDDKQITNKEQADNEQTANKKQTINIPLATNEEYKEDKELEEIKETKEGEEYTLTVSKDTVCQTQDVRRIVEAWNELGSYGIKTISRLSSSSQRYQRLSARIKQYGVDDVLSAIDKIKHSNFLQGKNNKGWTITFDWFVLPNNFPKVLDGNYDNGSHKQQYNSQTAQMLENSYDMMNEWAQSKKMEECGYDS